jgi:hypothetical protein
MMMKKLLILTSQKNLWGDNDFPIVNFHVQSRQAHRIEATCLGDIMYIHVGATTSKCEDNKLDK